MHRKIHKTAFRAGDFISETAVRDALRSEPRPTAAPDERPGSTESPALAAHPSPPRPSQICCAAGRSLSS